MKTVRKLERLFGMLALLVIAVHLASCCSDCPTGPGDPAAYKGWLYATDQDADCIYRIDTEIDSLIDSFRCDLSGNFVPEHPVVSKDGKYLAVAYIDQLNGDYFTQAYDAQSMSVIADINQSVYPYDFLTEDNLLVTVGNGHLVYYSIPDFAEAGEDSIISTASSTTWDIKNVDEDKGLFYLLITSILPSGRNSFSLATYDYRQKMIVDQWPLDAGHNLDRNFIFTGVEIDDNPLRMYFIGGSGHSDCEAGCYDFESGQMQFTFRLESYHGSLALSPDGNELYVTDPGWLDDPVSAGTVYVLDPTSGAYLHGISLYGYTSVPGQPLFANEVIFTPDGQKAYVGSGRLGNLSGTICAIDAKTREITSVIWPDLQHYIFGFAIAPKL